MKLISVNLPNYSSKHLTTRYDWIDALRAVAILMVIAVHAGHGLKNTESLVRSIFGFGGYGVQLFFVASAMTLCMSMQKNCSAKGYLTDYGLRRFFRIAPLYYVGIIVYFLWSIPKNYVTTGVFGPLSQYDIGNVMANFFLLNGFVPSANNNIVPGGWSIGTEVAFYVLFPLIFNTFVNRSKLQCLLLAVGIIFLEYLLLWYVETLFGVSVADNEFLYFNIITQLQVFVVGVLGYFCFVELMRLPNISQVLLVVLLFYIAFVGVGFLPKPNFFRLLVLSMAFVIFASIMAKVRVIPIMLVRIGQRSFSMYIVHFIFMNIIDHGFNNLINVFPSSPNIKALFHYAVAVVVTYWVSGYTKVLVEDRFIEIGREVIRRVANIQTVTAANESE